MMININFVLSCFTLLKLTIPKIVPFSFDVLFSDIDKLFHFNYQPWELTHGLFQSPYFSLTINILYNLWFFVLIYVLFYFIVTNAQNRKRYLLSFILSWFIIGNLFATLFSSVGPCFLFKLDPSETQFLPLMEILTKQSHLLTSQNWPELWAIGTQNTLWEKYVADDVMIGAGISAMPSMHVASTTLMALAIKRENHWFGNLFIAYAIIIQIGSVHLAWHYAIDGYLAAIMAWIIWHYVNRYYDNKQIVTPG
ncbi:phosphatase PAP2 family protein [Vibrio sp. JC009]|uniref:phosphatase PAP2 family protein n=1 Tax=Vibrio sp. JC009 TaxID=2912314 RepID=UPI0023B00AE4|nr:phosphatase PAP2 family protein [Vibrio sp. JC009]WED21267.1 phosphatase PAP2 family protein [Vibrio sp. JC009]